MIRVRTEILQLKDDQKSDGVNLMWLAKSQAFDSLICK